MRAPRMDKRYYTLFLYILQLLICNIHKIRQLVDFSGNDPGDRCVHRAIAANP
jgi:hypothetical protein